MDPTAHTGTDRGGELRRWWLRALLAPHTGSCGCCTGALRPSAQGIEAAILDFIELGATTALAEEIAARRAAPSSPFPDWVAGLDTARCGDTASRVLKVLRSFQGIDDA